MNEHGVTLVELMVVLVFVAIGILAMSVVQTRTLTDVHATGRHTRALALAEKQMEAARGLGYTLARSDSGVTGLFAWRCLVDSADVGLKRVTSTVSWAEAGVPRSLRLVNLISTR